MDDKKEVVIISKEEFEEEYADSKVKSAVIKYFEIGFAAFLVVAASILFYFCLFKFYIIRAFFSKLMGVVAPIILGFALAYVLSPVVTALENFFLRISDKYEAKKAQDKKKEKKKEPSRREQLKKMEEEKSIGNTVLDKREKKARNLAIFVTMVVAFSLITLLLMSLIPSLISSVVTLTDRVPVYYQRVSDWAVEFVDKRAWLKKHIPDAGELIAKYNVFELLSNYLNSILATAYNWVVVAFKIVFRLIVGFVVAIYLLAGKERYIGQLKKFTFAVMKKRSAKNFVQALHQTNLTFKHAILGKILDSMIIGFLCFIGSNILGICGFEVISTNALLISFVVGVTNVIPYFGPFIGAIPTVFLIFCEDPISGLVFAIFVLCLQQLDMNVIDPRCVGQSVGLSPFYVLSFCLISGGFFGVIGLLLATPTGAVIYGFVKAWMETRLEDKELPLETKDYAKTPGKVIYEQNGGNN